MIMPRLCKIAYLKPFILGNIINFTLLGGLIGILGSNSVDVVFCLEFKLTVEVGELMTGSGIDHACALHDFVLLFVYNVALIRKY